MATGFNRFGLSAADFNPLIFRAGFFRAGFADCHAKKCRKSNGLSDFLFVMLVTELMFD